MGFPSSSFLHRVRALRRVHARRQRERERDIVALLQRLEPRLLLAAVINGTVWQDHDGDGLRDAGEPGLAGWTVYVDTDDDQVLDAADIRQASDANGDYSLTGVADGTQRIRIVQQSGWRQTTPQFSAAVNILLPIAAARDLLYDPTRHMLYATTAAGNIERFDLETWAMLAPIRAGDDLAGFDITQDGSALYVAEAAQVGNQGVFRKIDLASGAVSSLMFDHEGRGAPFDVVIGPDGRAKISTASGQGRVYDYDPATDSITQFTAISSTAHFSAHRSADRQTFFFGSVTSSPASVISFDAAGGQVIDSASIGSLVDGITAVSRDGARIAVEHLGLNSISLYDRLFNFVGSIPTAAGGFVFDPLLDVIYAVIPALNVIAAYSTTTLAQLHTIPIGEDVGNSFIHGAGEMEVSADGQYLFLTTPTGVRVINRNSVLHSGPYTETLTSTTVRNNRNFGFKPAAVSELTGVVWEDANNNGAIDAGEAPLGGRSIYIDVDSNGQFDDAEPRQVTDAQGAYRFTGLVPGSYSVRHDVPATEQLFPVSYAASSIPSTAIAMPDAQDVLYDPVRNRFYFTTDTGFIQRWDVASQTLLSPFDAGTKLNGFDISPDFASLYVAEEATIGNQGFVRKVNLETGVVVDLPFTLDFLESGAWDVAIGGGRAYVTTRFNGSGSVDRRAIDLATDTFIPLAGSFRQDTTLDRSGDGSLIFLSGSNVTPSTVHLMNAATGQFVTTFTFPTFTDHMLAAMNEDGSLLAYQFGGHTTVVNTAFDGVELFKNLSGGMVFDPDRPVLYAVDGITNELVGIDMTRNREVFRVPAGENLTAGATRYGPGGMALGGGYVAVITPAGVRFWDINTTPAPGYTVTLGAGDLSSRNDFGDRAYDVFPTLAPLSVMEDSGAGMVYTFTRRGDTTAPLTLNFNVAGSATFGVDYTQIGAATFDGLSGTVTFPAGSATATVTIIPTADAADEPDETVQFSIAPGAGYSDFSAAALTGTIFDDEQTVTVTRSPSSASEDTATVFVYTFTRNKTGGALAVNLDITGTATFASDYTQTGASTFSTTHATVTFAPGSTIATITIDSTADTAIEASETVTIGIAPGTYLIGSPSVATTTITNDDQPTVTLTSSPASVTENGAANIVYTFTRNSTIGALFVSFNSSGATATFNTDYTVTGATSFNGAAGNITFADGSSTHTLTFDPTGDTTAEPDETVMVVLVTNGSAYKIGNPSGGPSTITNDDVATVTFTSSASVTVVEGGANSSPLTLTRTNTVGALDVSYRFEGTAVRSTDWQMSPGGSVSGNIGHVIFADGSSTATLTIDPIHDSTVEAHETIVLTLINGMGYTVGSIATRTITIRNDDTPTVTLALAPYAATETGDGTLQFIVTRTGSPVDGTNASTINFAVAGSALFPGDYSVTGAAAFNATTGSVVVNGTGLTSTGIITIDPTADGLPEDFETILLTLTTGTGYALGSTISASGVISSNVPPPAPLTLSVTLSPIAFSEGGGSTTGTVTRGGPIDSDLVVHLTSSDPTEAAVPATVTIPAGQASVTFPVTAVDDGVIDGIQSLTITASNGVTPIPVAPDPSFGTGGLVTTSLTINSSVAEAAIAIQPDGRIIVAAADSDTSRWRIMRLLPGGMPDDSFGTAGVVTTAFPSTGPVPRRILIQPDGKIIVGGQLVTTGGGALVRYDENGVPDPDFGVAGIADMSATGGWVEDMDLAPDGKIMLAVGFTGTADFRAARVSAGGVVEDVYTFLSTNTAVRAIVALADGRFLMTGGSRLVARATSDGLIDESFGDDGEVIVTFGVGTTNAIDDLMLDVDGTILISAAVGSPTRNFALSRLSYDGALDTSFGNAGAVVTDFNALNDTPAALILQPDRKILVVGDTEIATGSFDAAIARYHSNGTLDLSFDGDGRYQRSVLTSSGERLFGAALQADGMLISLHGFASNVRVLRTDFGQQPVVGSAPLQVADDEADLSLSVSITPGAISENGGVATGTVTRTGPTTASLVVSLLSSDPAAATVPATVTIPAGSSSATFPVTGTNDALLDATQTATITASVAPIPVGLDPTFGSGGLAVTPLSLPGGTHKGAVAIQADGKVLAAAGGPTNNSWRIARYHPNGLLDTTFGGGAGYVTTVFATNTVEPEKIVIQPNGKIIVGGRLSDGASTGALARYNADGSPDNSFGSGGVADLSGVDGWVVDMALEADGRLLLDINYNGTVDFRAARVSASGVLQSIFNYPAIDGLADTIQLLPDGRFILAGRNLVAVSNPNGTLDQTFGVSGVATLTFPGKNNSRIRDIALDAQGRILLAAYIFDSNVNNSYDMAVARLLPSGGLDTSFGTGGYATTDFAGVDEGVVALLMQADGRIVLAGSTENAENNYDSALVRYTANGALDPTFDGDGRFRASVLAANDEPIVAAALRPDGKLVAFHASNNDYTLGRFHMALPIPGSATVDVTDDDTVVNHAPTDIALSPAAIQENAAIGTPVGNLATTDPDAGNTHTYALVNGTGDAGNVAFIIAGDQLLTAQVFDREVQSSYTVRIRSTDAGGLSVEMVFTISITDLDEIAPTVTRVFLDSSAWSDSYRDHMQDIGIGTAFGYAVPTGTNQFKPLPWNINRIGVQFSEHVDVQQSDFSLLGVNTQDYAAWLTGGAFSYDAGTFTAMWTLAAPLGVDKLRLILSDRMTDAAGNPLDGEMADGVSTQSGDGGPGDGFAFRFNLLPGDVNQNEGILGDDVILVRNAQFRSTSSPGYSPLLDVNGSGTILGDDVILVRNKQFSMLPAGEPGWPSELMAELSVSPVVLQSLSATAAVTISREASAKSQDYLANMAALFSLSAADKSALSSVRFIQHQVTPNESGKVALPSTNPFFVNLAQFGAGQLSPYSAHNTISRRGWRQRIPGALPSASIVRLPGPAVG